MVKKTVNLLILAGIVILLSACSFWGSEAQESSGISVFTNNHPFGIEFDYYGYLYVRSDKLIYDVDEPIVLQIDAACYPEWAELNEDSKVKIEVKTERFDYELNCPEEISLYQSTEYSLEDFTFKKDWLGFVKKDELPFHFQLTLRLKEVPVDVPRERVVVIIRGYDSRQVELSCIFEGDQIRLAA